MKCAPFVRCHFELGAVCKYGFLRKNQIVVSGDVLSEICTFL